MVTFSCDTCGDTLKKNQVDKHMGRCRAFTFACIDCNVYFDRNSYREHIKCVSEDQRYGGKNYVAKENKGEVKQNLWVNQVQAAIDHGEVKQNLWVNQVQAAIDHVKDTSLKGLLNRIAEFDNIPRKEAKFINFLQNSMRIRDRNLCVKAWSAIDTEAKRLKAEEEEPKRLKAEEEERKKAEKEAKEAAEAKAKDNAEASNTETEDAKSQVEKEVDAEASDSTTESAKSFKWKKAIKRRLREADDGEMKIKKLRKVILSDYAVATQTEGAEEDDALKAVFAEKLDEAGVVVEGKVVKLSS
uniref:Zf-LYAR domain-containing protein n=1 Tax=Steinernema glaseri TaxID=37863 RepID=A0A1I7Y5U6_9BILA